MTEILDAALMDKRLHQLNEAKQKFNQNSKISVPKIQRVPNILRQNDQFVKYFTPKIISFGPIHHDSENVKEGEKYKLLWTSIFIEEYGTKIGEDANQACKLLFKKIEDNIEELKNMFHEDTIERYNDSDLAWMLFVDGCSLLHFMINVDVQCPKALHIKFDQLMHMWRDVILLENQLPSKILEILCEDTGFNLQYCFSNYHSMGEYKRHGIVLVAVDKPNPFHVLDYLRSFYLSQYYFKDFNFEGDNQMETQSDNNEDNQMGNTILNQQDFGEILYINLKNKRTWNTYKSISDLKKAGIRVMPNETDEWNWNNISFTSKWFSGELRLPTFFFNDVTPYVFRNLIAFEMCPDVHYNYECCSFFSFMDSLIDTAEDVKELRLAGVLQNLLESDEEELAKLFNQLGHDLPTKMCCNYSSNKVVTFSKKYISINLQIKKHQIGKHYNNKLNTWLAQAYNTHFNNPWAIIAFFAALLALVLTFIQTWFAMHPPKP